MPTVSPIAVASGNNLRAETRKRGLLIVLAVALFAVAGVLIMRDLTPPENDPLRGDAEETAEAMPKKLSTMSDAVQVETLRAYANDPSPGLRFNAIDKISERKDPMLADVLERAYTDSSSTVRSRVLETLPDIDREEGLHLLLCALQDEDTWMREAAIQQLQTRALVKGGIVDKKIVPNLIAALDDKDPVLPFTAVHLLVRLTGNPWQYRNETPAAEKLAVVRRWKDWWKTVQHDWVTTPEDVTAAPIRPTRHDLAPDFHLTDIDGQPISRDGQRNRVTLLNFWGTWCPPCQKEIPDLARLDRDMRSQGVDMIGIALAEGADTVRHYCAEHKVAYRQALADERMLHDYGDIHEVPVSILIDGQGRIRRRWEGERDYTTFRAAIDFVQAKTDRDR